MPIFPIPQSVPPLFTKFFRLSCGFRIGRLPYTCILPSKVFLGVLDLFILQMCPAHSSLQSLMCWDVYIPIQTNHYFMIIAKSSLSYIFLFWPVYSSKYFPFKSSKGHFHTLGHCLGFAFVIMYLSYWEFWEFRIFWIMIITINSKLIPNNRMALQLTANFLHMLRYMTFLGPFKLRPHAQLQ